MKLHRLIFIALLLSSFAVFVPFQAAQATVVAELSDSQLVDYSDYILHATILHTEPILYDENTIVTRVTVQVQEYLKAPSDCVRTSQFEFYTRGGRVGDMSQFVPGEYEPVSGTEGIFFLEKIRRFQGFPFVLGLTQGVFATEEHPVTRADRRSSKTAYRTSEFVRTKSGFDRAADFDALLDSVRHAVANRGGGQNHE